MSVLSLLRLRPSSQAHRKILPILKTTFISDITSKTLSETIEGRGELPLPHAECPAQGPEHQPPGTAGRHVLHQEVNLAIILLHLSVIAGPSYLIFERAHSRLK